MDWMHKGMSLKIYRYQTSYQMNIAYFMHYLLTFHIYVT